MAIELERRQQEHRIQFAFSSQIATLVFDGILDSHQPHIQVVPGRAGGGSFKRKKNYIARKEFAYRMCAR